MPQRPQICASFFLLEVKAETKFHFVIVLLLAELRQLPPVDPFQPQPQLEVANPLVEQLRGQGETGVLEVSYGHDGWREVEEVERLLPGSAQVEILADAVMTRIVSGTAMSIAMINRFVVSIALSSSHFSSSKLLEISTVALSCEPPAWPRS